MLERTAEATWRGDLARGKGTFRFGARSRGRQILRTSMYALLIAAQGRLNSVV